MAKINIYRCIYSLPFLIYMEGMMKMFSIFCGGIYITEGNFSVKYGVSYLFA